MSPLLPDLLRALAALAFTLGLLLAGAKALQLINQKLESPSSGKPKKRLQLKEKLTLTPTTSLYLVEVDGTEHLLANTSSTITEIPLSKKAKRA